jgi:1-acyl-sn-glycerol-3-phosphate acyltransferase
MTTASLWLPRSACTSQCAGRAGRFRPGRVVALAAVILGGAALALTMRGRARHALVRGLARGALRAIGVRLVVRGRLPRSGALLVANHVSWLDALVLTAVAPARTVAKREVRTWPVVGAVAAASGTIFIDRVRPRTLPATVGAVAAVLRAGRSVAAFPEGTTSCGAGPSTFRPALFQAAIDAGAPVVPLAIRYDSPAAAFVGDDTLLASIRRVAATRRLTVTLTVSAPLYPEPGADRRALARAAESAITPSTGPHGFTLAA